MFCSSCGTQVQGGDAYCQKCGNELSRSPQTVTVANFYEGKNTQIVGGVIIAIAVLAMMSSCGVEDTYVSARTFGAGGLLFVFGAVVVAAGRLKNWYHAG